MNKEKHIEVVKRAVYAASEIIAPNFDDLNTVESKNEYKEMVTDLDFKSEAKILEILADEFPDYNVYSEESANQLQGSEYTWVVDPLDGTANLTLGLPIIAVSIGLLKGNQVVLGMVHHVMRNRTYFATQGDGCTLNDTPIQVSKIDNLGKASIGHIVSYQEKKKPRALNVVTSFRSQCFRLLDTWAPAVEWSLLAQGKLDGLISLGSDIYDRIAGSLLVEEAGGKITDLQGNPVDHFTEDFVVASNNTSLHDQLLAIIREYYDGA